MMIRNIKKILIKLEKDTIFNMLTMYAINSKTYRWWQNINVIIWGASTKLV
ncbi:MAG: hypothetical protein BWX87_02496 [Bacteroidetes bacterium ADurb.Bin123]|nr:MAG: hypothetical protein BWX87_02496 [Bacteroidetes bacterium ADurb.Bin123]